MIPVSAPSITELEIANVNEAVRSGWVSSKGEFVGEFEKTFASFCGARFASTTANGTVALHLALLSLGIGVGDEIIVPTFTFVGTVSPILYLGAVPVFVDCDINHWCIDPDQIERKITARTKAIIVVHLYGHPTEMQAVRKVAKKHNLFVIEDAAEAHGALYRNKTVGALSDVSIFSFYGNKIITTGEGGMVLANNKKIIEKVNVLKNHGMSPSRRYWHPELGYNYRMTNLQAALGMGQMSRIGPLLAKKRTISEWYHRELDENLVIFQKEMPWARSVYWMVSVILRPIKNAAQREKLMVELMRRGIESRPFFYPVHLFPPFRKYARNERFPVVESIYHRGICLPSGADITEMEVLQVCRELNSLLA